MSRYREPVAASTPIISSAGFERLKQEQQELWQRRRVVTAALAAAAAEGDRSENAEYIYRKKELRELDRRLRYVQKRLPIVKVVREPPSDTSRVFFGATVELCYEAGEHLVVRIVGPDEIDPASACIIIDSVMSRALLKASVGDEVEVAAPRGTQFYEVISIKYD